MNSWGDTTYKYLQVSVAPSLVAKSARFQLVNSQDWRHSEEDVQRRTYTFLMPPLQPASPLWQHTSSGRSHMRTLSGEMLSRISDTSHLRSFSPLRKQVFPSSS